MAKFSKKLKPTEDEDELLEGEESEDTDSDDNKDSKSKKAKKSAKDNDSSILDTIAEIKSRFGDESIMKLGEKPRLNVDVVSTGSIGLHAALGVGGLPKGRIIEIFGPESSGKTTLALHVIAESQKKGGVCAYIDAEHAMDPDYAGKLGVNINNLLISQPDAGEQALEITESLVRSGKIDVIVIDSVAALTPKDEIEGDMAELGAMEDSDLIAKKVVKRETDTALILDPKMSLAEELKEYLLYILQIDEAKSQSLVGLFNDNSHKIEWLYIKN